MCLIVLSNNVAKINILLIYFGIKDIFSTFAASVKPKQNNLHGNTELN